MKSRSKWFLILFVLHSFLLVSCSTQHNMHANNTQLAMNKDNNKGYGVAMTIAQAALRTNNIEIAIRALKAAHQQQPKNPEPVIALSQLYLDSKQYQAVINFDTNALKELSTSPAVQAILYRHIGISAIHLNYTGLAAEAFKNAYRSTTQSDQILNDVGVLLDQSDHHLQAQQCYHKGLKINPQNDIIVSNMALSFISVGNIEQAKYWLNSPVVLNSTHKMVEQDRNIALEAVNNTPSNANDSQLMALRKKFGLTSNQVPIDQISYAKLVQICS